MMNEKLSDVRDFVRELIKTDEFEDELFLSTINNARDNLKKSEEEACYEDEGVIVGIGDKTYMDIKGDSAMVLQNKDEFNLLLRWDNSTPEDHFAINYGKLELGFQIYPKKEFRLSRDFIGFTLTIDGVLECSAFPVDLNFASDDFYLSEDLDYTFEILLVEGKEGILLSVHETVTDFSLAQVKYDYDEELNEAKLKFNQMINSYSIDVTNEVDLAAVYLNYSCTVKPEGNLNVKEFHEQGMELGSCV